MAEISAVKERGLRIRLEEDIRRMLLKNMTSMNVEAIVALKQPLLYDSSGISKIYILLNTDISHTHKIIVIFYRVFSIIFY